ncbi:MAG TPA: gas vesicle protein GvpG [Myxococcales bacterium]|jgi:gas vesicle protein GvpG
MLIIDKMLASGIKFVLDKVAAAVDAELNDDSRLREELLAAQMRLELGEITQEEFAGFEKDVLARLREIRERQRSGDEPGELKVVGVEATANFEQE